MKLIIASRDYRQIGIDLKFKITFRCSKCKKDVVPDEFLIGKKHVYALHCELQQEIGCVA